MITQNTAARYLVAPITSADCDAIHTDRPVIRTNSLATASHRAAHGPHPFGCGVLDTKTGLLDVGYGFGVPCPDPSEDC